MRAIITAAIAAIEAVAVALATLLIVVVLALLIWWTSFDLAAEPKDVFAAAGSTWLLAHFAPLAFEVPAEMMQMLGFGPDPLTFSVTLVPLGLTAVTMAYAARSGWRFGGRGGSGIAVAIGGPVGFGAAVAAVSAFVPTSERSLWLTVLVPALAYGAFAAVAFVCRSVQDQHDWWTSTVEFVESSLGRMKVSRPVVVTQCMGDAFRLAVMLLAGYIAVAAAGVAVAVVVGYIDVIAMMQALQLDIWGALMMFVVQLALLPTIILWSGAWFTGAGFAVGLGSSASPFAALLGPLPGIPVTAAIPDGWGSLAVVAPLLLALIGIVVGVAGGKAARRLSWPALFGVVVGAAALVGLIIAGLNWIANGSIGPGRLSVTGPDVWLVAGLAAAELGVGCLLGAFAVRADLARKAAWAPQAAIRKFGGAEERFPASKEAVSGFADTVETWGATSTSVQPAAPDQPSTIDQRLKPVRASVQTEAVSEPAPGLARVVAFPTVRSQDSAHSERDNPDEFLTEPLDIDVSELQNGAPGIPEPPVREPELFDQHEAEPAEVEPLPNESIQTNTRAKFAKSTARPRTSVRLSEVDPADPEALIDAYSWDNVDGAAADGAGTSTAQENADVGDVNSKPRWRWPSRRG